MQDGFNKMKRRILFRTKRNADRIFLATHCGIKSNFSFFVLYFIVITFASKWNLQVNLYRWELRFLWTLASIACEVAGKQFGAVILNVWRMLLTFFALILFLWWAMDNPFPIYASTNTIIWLMLFGCCGLFLWRLVFIKRISNYRRTIWSIDYDSRPTLRCLLCIYLSSSNAYMAKSVGNACHSFGNCYRSVGQGRIE